ncbi:tetraacyldisaccharide 4'-kinase [Desulfococcaceae bacterium HSG9]|nr:tetraacyldisaccharide 4'-kinase [Desulfococcaceae bacterium HSG9]
MFILSRLYKISVQLRAFSYKKKLFKSHRLPCIVISIGNLTAGGTGKTPMTIYLARLCQRLGYRTVVVCRGYKGQASKQGGIVSDGQTVRMNYVDAGDEPLMIARLLRDIPVVIGSSRYKAGCLAINRFSPDVIILDDGFQHLRLSRDINILLLDYARPFGNAHLLPRGPLREPFQALKRADTCIFTRCDSKPSAGHDKAMQKINFIHGRRPLFKTVHSPIIRGIIPAGTTSPDRLVTNMKIETENIAVYAFCGLAHNADFRRTLKRLGFQTVGFSGFPDHYAYTDRDIDTIKTAVISSGAELIITSDKDYTRLDSSIKWPTDLVVIGVEIKSKGDERLFDDYIEQRLMALKSEIT